MIRKALHIILASVVVISTMGITINMHFCHDELIDFALYSPAESCCEIDPVMHCHAEEGLMQKDHCEDDSIVLEALEDFVGSACNVDLKNIASIDLLFREAFIHNFSGINDFTLAKVPEYYQPPPFQEVDLSRIQSFLI